MADDLSGTTTAKGATVRSGPTVPAAPSAAALFGAWALCALFEAYWIYRTTNLGLAAFKGLAAVCGFAFCTCVTTSLLLLWRRQAARRIGSALGAAYAVLWLATAVIGTSSLEFADEGQFSRQFGIHSPAGSSFVRIDADPYMLYLPFSNEMPPESIQGRTLPNFWYFTDAKVPSIPFPVRLDFAYSAGLLRGRGGVSYWIWIFGWKAQVASRTRWVA